MCANILKRNSWVCSCCVYQCKSPPLLEPMSHETFDFLEKALSFDARIFFSLCCDYNSNGFCTAAQFFNEAQKVRYPLTKNQISILRDIFRSTWKKLTESLSVGVDISLPAHKKLHFQCICGSDVDLSISEHELNKNTSQTDPFPVTISHQNKNGSYCYVLVYISKYGEIRSIEPINGIIQVKTT